MAKSNPWEKIEQARRLDVELARVVMAEPERYTGIMLLWARRVIEREESEKKPNAR